MPAGRGLPKCHADGAAEHVSLQVRCVRTFDYARIAPPGSRGFRDLFIESLNHNGQLIRADPAVFNGFSFRHDILRKLSIHTGPQLDWVVGIDGDAGHTFDGVAFQFAEDGEEILSKDIGRTLDAATPNGAAALRVPPISLLRISSRSSAN